MILSMAAHLWRLSSWATGSLVSVRVSHGAWSSLDGRARSDGDEEP